MKCLYNILKLLNFIGMNIFTLEYMCIPRILITSSFIRSLVVMQMCSPYLWWIERAKKWQDHFQAHRIPFFVTPNIFLQFCVTVSRKTSNEMLQWVLKLYSLFVWIILLWFIRKSTEVQILNSFKNYEIYEGN